MLMAEKPVDIKKTEGPVEKKKKPIKVSDTMQVLALLIILAYMAFIALKHHYII